MDELEEPGATTSDVGADLHHPDLFVLFRALLGIELGFDVARSYRFESKSFESLARLSYEFIRHLDSVQYWN